MDAAPFSHLQCFQVPLILYLKLMSSLAGLEAAQLLFCLFQDPLSVSQIPSVPKSGMDTPSKCPRQSHSRSAKRLTAENNQRREKTWCTTHQSGLHYKCSSCWFKAFPYICPTCSCVLIIARTCSNWEGILDTRNEITYLLLKLFHLKFDFYVFLPFISLLVSRNCKKNVLLLNWF